MDKGIVSRRKPRICMLTTRNFALNAWRCGFYDGQDVLLEVDDVDLIPLMPGKAYRLREAFQRDLIWHDFTRKAVSINMAYRPIRLAKEYDLFIAFVQQPRDLIHVPAVRGWKDYCRTSICWIEEFWATNIPKPESWISALSQFDYVAIGFKGTVKAASDALNRTCHWVPSAVDTIRFSPYPSPPGRVIDVYSIGPIWEGLHRNFLGMAAEKKLFYVFDTFHASDAQVKDHRQHRTMFADMAKRSRYFIVAPAKAYKPEETQGQIEVGMRYFEASSAGAVMLGQAPNCDSFKTMFDWPDAVIEVKPDGSDVTDVLSSLAAQPKRLVEISRRNAVEALLRHDWVYRWEKILRIAGLEPIPELFKRKERLENLSKMIESESSNS